MDVSQNPAAASAAAVAAATAAVLLHAMSVWWVPATITAAATAVPYQHCTGVLQRVYCDDRLTVAIKLKFETNVSR